MKLRPKITLLDHFEKLTDPRVERTKAHKLVDILSIAICAMICGADNWVAMEQKLNTRAFPYAVGRRRGVARQNMNG